ncbi:DUF2306 domain-containing protein [Hyphococcus luteus]|nr:DUF2306 domain-containing protein [Marinicaulis flavus]
MKTKTSSNPAFRRIFRLSGATWFCVAVMGQAIFVIYILGFYGLRTATGDYAGWNDRQVITGHVAGDDVGNVVFALHVLLAAVMTASGVLQLIPALRRRFPAFHRWNGRVFLALAVTMALSGLWATWVRGSYLSIISGLSVSLNGVLILIFAAQTIRHAVARRIAVHEVWAMRLFMVASGVWFFRVGIMAWVILNQGPRGNNETLTGPADIGLSLSSYLLPLAAYEIYRAGKRTKSASLRLAVMVLVAALTLVTLIGVGGAAAFMWLPALTTPQ